MNALTPAELARLFVSRGVSGSDIALVEIEWDTLRYEHPAQLVNMLVGFVDQLLGVIGEPQGETAAQVWQRFMLNEANS